MKYFVMICGLFLTLNLFPAQTASVPLVGQQPRGECADLFIILMRPLYSDQKLVSFFTRKHFYTFVTLYNITRGFYYNNQIYMAVGTFLSLWAWYFCSHRCVELEEERQILVPLQQENHIFTAVIQVNQVSVDGFRPLVA